MGDVLMIPHYAFADSLNQQDEDKKVSKVLATHYYADSWKNANGGKEAGPLIGEPSCARSCNGAGAQEATGARTTRLFRRRRHTMSRTSIIRYTRAASGSFLRCRSRSTPDSYLTTRPTITLSPEGMTWSANTTSALLPVVVGLRRNRFGYLEDAFGRTCDQFRQRNECLRGSAAVRGLYIPPPGGASNYTERGK